MSPVTCDTLGRCLFTADHMLVHFKDRHFVHVWRVAVETTLAESLFGSSPRSSAILCHNWNACAVRLAPANPVSSKFLIVVAVLFCHS